MTLTTHAAAGMLVAEWTGSILIGFIFAIASHYLLDAVPHGDEFIYWRYVHNTRDAFALLVGATDFFALLVIVLLAINSVNDYRTMTILVGTIGGILPDALVNVYTKHFGPARAPVHTTPGESPSLAEKLLKEHYAFHMFFHNTLRIPIRFRTAVAYQCVFLVCFIYFFLFH